MLALENELICEDRAMSLEDRAVLDFWETNGRLNDSHYELPIPWVRKQGNKRQPKFQNNREQAMNRYITLKKPLMKDTDMNKSYKEGIHALINKGYAELVPTEDFDRNDMQVFYIPHHPVHNVHKRKIRIVFDCSAKFYGASLNDEVLQGPDLTNKLTSILLRFRENQIAVVGDIEAMYHQVRVPVHDRDALRFLWSDEDSISNSPSEYRMTVHLFGGIWSFSAANYALRRTADENQDKYIPAAAHCVRSNFYVDDWLFSSSSPKEAIEMIENVTGLLKEGGFKLAKFISTDRDVLKYIPNEDRSASLTDIDLDKHELPQERALGVKWNLNEDVFTFNIDLMNKPLTRRGVIGVISSIYDPLGFVSPVVVYGKTIFGELTKLHLEWDDSIPSQLQENWHQWLSTLPEISKMKIPRCIKPQWLRKVHQAGRGASLCRQLRSSLWNCYIPEAVRQNWKNSCDADDV